MPWSCIKSPYFVQILKADMNDIKFSKGFTLLWYVICFFALLLKPLSQEGSYYLIKLLDLNGLKVANLKWL